MAPTAAQDLDALVTPTIAVLMYAMFLAFLELRDGLSNKRFMSALLIANFVLIPMLVLGFTRGLTDHSAILVGTLLVLLTPCIDYVVVFTHSSAKATLAESLRRPQFCCYFSLYYCLCI